MRRPLCLICLAFVVTVMSVLIMHPPPSESYSDLVGRIVTLEGQVYRKEKKEDICYIYMKQIVISDEPIHSNSLSKYENLHSKTSQSNPESNKKNFDIQGTLCLLPIKLEPKMGSVLQIRGKVAIYPIATNEGEFDQQKYWKMQTIDFQLKDCAILKRSKHYNFWSEFLYQGRNKCGEVYDAILGERHASVLKAMILGDKKTLDRDIKNIYQRNGIAHILAISGLHISMIGMGIYKLLRKSYVPIGCASLISIFFMINYGIMTDMSSSACRATVMFAFYLLAKMTRRSYDMLTAMTLSAVYLIAEQPQYVFHTGFQLSFAAILAIGLVNPAFKHWFPSKIKCISSFFTSLSISVTTMPLLLFSFYEIPTYATLINVIIIPLMTIVLLSGIISILACEISIQLGKIAALPCTGIFVFYEWICYLAELLPMHSWIVGKPSIIQIILFYMGLLILVCCYERISWQGATLFLAIIISLLTVKIKDDLEITMIDVGQGDGFLIQNANGNAYLIDSGSSSRFGVGTYQVIPFLKAKGIGELQYVFASHSDKDHVNAIEEIIEQSENGNGIRMKYLVIPGIGSRDQDEAYKNIVLKAKEKNIPIIYMNKGDVLKDDNLKITCLHPPKKFIPENGNAYSNVLWISYRNFDALFTGDVEGNGEKELIGTLQNWLRRSADKNKDVHLEILKVAHHGSKNTTSDKFLALSNPQIGLLSCALHNSYGHPHKELLNRLEKHKISYFMTSQEGAVKIRTDGKKIWITTFFGNQKYQSICR